jgi:hypothetical protein
MPVKLRIPKNKSLKVSMARYRKAVAFVKERMPDTYNYVHDPAKFSMGIQPVYMSGHMDAFAMNQYNPISRALTVGLHSKFNTAHYVRTLGHELQHAADYKKSPVKHLLKSMFYNARDSILHHKLLIAAIRGKNPSKLRLAVNKRYFTRSIERSANAKGAEMLYEYLKHNDVQKKVKRLNLHSLRINKKWNF